MRKDVKLGLAVGGVLLAVLVVYVLVVPGNNANQVGATLETVDGSELVEGGAGADGNAGSGNETGSRPMADADTSRDRYTDAGSASRGNGDTSADAGESSGGATGANRGASTSDGATGESADGGWNWDALVNGTEKLPSLNAGTDIATNDATFVIATDGSVGNGAMIDNSGSGNGTPRGNTFADNGNAADGNGENGNLSADGAVSSDNRAGDATLQDAPMLPDSSASRSPTRQDATGGRPRNDNSAPVTGSTRTHVVKIGETYSSISAAAYGSSKYYAHIEHANPGIDPVRLKPGMTITLPAIESKPAAASSAVARQQQTIDPLTQYKVQPNDSLYTISLRLYGKADRVQKIYELNKNVIGDDMSRVKVGMVLKLPEAPTQTAGAVTAR